VGGLDWRILFGVLPARKGVGRGWGGAPVLSVFFFGRSEFVVGLIFLFP